MIESGEVHETHGRHEKDFSSRRRHMLSRAAFVSFVDPRSGSLTAMRALFALFVRSLREDTRARLPILMRATLVVVILLVVWANQRDFTRR